MRGLGLVFLLGSVACGSDSNEPLSEPLPDSVWERCASTPALGFVPDSFDAKQLETRAMLQEIGYSLAGSPEGLGWTPTVHLCALKERPLARGDSVVRIVRLPAWDYDGHSYVIRLQARGGRTELVSRVAAVCRMDSLFVAHPPVWDSVRGDSVLWSGRTEDYSPGVVEYETRVEVPRDLFRDVLEYLEEWSFWESDDPVPVPDGRMTRLEVQLGDRHRTLALANFSQPVFAQVVEEAGLMTVDCSYSVGREFTPSDWPMDAPLLPGY